MKAAIMIVQTSDGYRVDVLANEGNNPRFWTRSYTTLGRCLTRLVYLKLLSEREAHQIDMKSFEHEGTVHTFKSETNVQTLIEAGFEEQEMHD